MYKITFVLTWGASVVQSRIAHRPSRQRNSRPFGGNEQSVKALAQFLLTVKPAAALASRTIAAGLQANHAEHAAERAASGELGFARAAVAVPVSLPAASYKVRRKVLGLGNACPFDTDTLVFASQPMFTATECHAVRDEAEAFLASNTESPDLQGWVDTMADSNRDVPLHDLPKALEWFNSAAFARVASFAADCFPSAVDHAADLWVYRALVIHYDAAKGLTHQPIHRDGALLSCVISLSEPGEYSGGGTYIEPLNRSIVLEQGCALLHPSALRHTGHRISSGDRWVLVLFLNTHAMQYCEHGRRFRARAQGFSIADGSDGGLDLSSEIQEEDLNDSDADKDEQPQLECLLHALQVTGESNYEVLFDLGIWEHNRGDAAKALHFYQRATAINPLDALVLANMGAAYFDLGRLCKAFRYYRLALAVDPHNIDARFSAAKVLLLSGRLRGLARLLADAPEDVMRDEDMQAMSQELACLQKAEAEQGSPE
mmetsp:Transcript_84438/g.161388  ORF Transcript_84438/g.161388 Transcript_84438/m.161388 type:complete len:487 (+) Transcript_84438:63-1523(+)